MNILFYTPYEVSVINGGTERITSTIATALRTMGNKCYSAYCENDNDNQSLTEFDGKINLSCDCVEPFIKANHIECIILQQMTKDVKTYRKIIDSLDYSCKLYSVLNFTPGSEEILNINFSRLLNNLLFNNGNLFYKIKTFTFLTLYPIYRKWFTHHNSKLYKTVYENSDKVVLLSHKFENHYAQYAKINSLSKFVIIPNALSFNTFFPIDKIQKKKKQVLIVSRLSEEAKRITLAIKIWSLIENDKLLDEWNLIIVGTGNSEKAYHKLVKEIGLTRISFEGRKNSFPYYQDSRIFMMTSIIEGWGLTLTEAQQMGCVPLAFNSYASVTDIINDGKNGFLVKYGDLNTYYQRMRSIMIDDNKWSTMAIEAINSSKRFEIANIVKKWETLIIHK